MTIENKYIDFVLTSKNIHGGSARSKVKRPFKDSKIGDLVAMAVSAVPSYMSMEELNGIRKCIEFGILRMQVKKPIFFSIHRWSPLYALGSKPQPKDLSMLSNSLALTVLLYRHQLNEHHTNLSTYTFNELAIGMEWCLHWSEYIIVDPFSEEKNHFIEWLAPESINPYIHAGQP